jgi:hypothetical protein
MGLFAAPLDLWFALVRLVTDACGLREAVDAKREIGGRIGDRLDRIVADRNALPVRANSLVAVRSRVTLNEPGTTAALFHK